MDKYNDFASSMGVAIPIIQRDYVQGANVNSEKRDKFLVKLFDALLTGEKCEIDFIYGSSDKKENGEILFQPVDGQQRLTTLALIGWILNQKCSMLFSNKFKEITYSTRPSTEQFCKELFNCKLPDEYGTISKYIKTQPGWFSDSWLSDPSVNSMLEFLDKADSLLSDEKYSSKVEQMADCFFNNCPIVFEKLDMKALNLNDDLYIKMNARGKLLTPFENWKAEFEGFLSKEFPKELYEHNTIPEEKGEPTIPKYFEYAIEHEWCDLLWPIAYNRWIKMEEGERRKYTYPRIDEFFMNLLDYISRFLYFSSLKDAEEEVKNSNVNEVRMLYDKEKDKSRIEVYKDVKNVVLLFRILDTLVSIRNKHKTFDNFFNLFFISDKSKNRLDMTKVNLFVDIDKSIGVLPIDLLSSCLVNKLEATTEVMLWAVLKWLLYHPENLESERDYPEVMTNFLRIIMGWARGKRQRIIKGLSVNVNLRLTDYYEANEIIEKLAQSNSSSDLFKALANTTNSSLLAEREKGSYYGNCKYDIIRQLSTCVELYYCFNVFFPSMTNVADNEPSVASYINRFYEFISLNDEKRIKELNARGFKGVNTKNNLYFYGKDGKWDFIFTIDKKDSGFNQLCNAFTSWMNNDKHLQFTNSEMAYYIDKYPDFMNARYCGNRDYEPCHYFMVNNEFTVLAVKTFSDRPYFGYNVNPYAYTVEKIYKGSHKIFAFSKDYDDSVLDIDDNGMTMECCQEGWRVFVHNPECDAAKSFFSRYNEKTNFSDNKEYVDSKGKFKFNEYILLDLDNRDRIETALDFLSTI